MPAWSSISRLETGVSTSSTPMASKVYAPISIDSGLTPLNRSRLSLKTPNRKKQILNMQQTKPSVRKVVLVNVDPEHAFAVFTRKMGQWWPKEHHIGGSPMVEVVVEPRGGRRWHENAAARSECAWGTVLAYEAPRS